MHSLSAQFEPVKGLTLPHTNSPPCIGISWRAVMPSQHHMPWHPEESGGFPGSDLQMFGHVITIRVLCCASAGAADTPGHSAATGPGGWAAGCPRGHPAAGSGGLHQQTADAEPAEQPSPSRTEAMVGRITITAAVSKAGAYTSCLMKLGCRGGPHHLLVSCPRCAKLKLRQCPPLTAFLHWCCRRVVCSVTLPALLRAAHPKYFSLQ